MVRRAKRPLARELAAFEQAGDTPPSDKETKDDLLRVLPERIQLDLPWSASDQTKDFVQFRDLVVAASAKILNIQRPQRGIHQVASEQQDIPARMPANMEPQDLAMFEGVSNAEDLTAAFQKYKNMKGNNGGGNGGLRPRRDTRQRDARQESGDRSLRKCANCGKEHAARVCPEPPVPVDQRRCWTCGEKHMARDCPQKGKNNGRAAKAIQDVPIASINPDDLIAPFGCISVVDHEGCQMVPHRRHRRTFKPSGGVT